MTLDEHGCTVRQVPRHTIGVPGSEHCDARGSLRAPGRPVPDPIAERYFTKYRDVSGVFRVLACARHGQVPNTVRLS